MDLERERVIEIVAAVGAVGLMIAVMMWVGSTYGELTNDGLELVGDGGMMLVGSVIFFILLMAGVGVVLAYTVSAKDDVEEDDELTADQ